MRSIKTRIHGAALLVPEIFEDKRGFFMETWNRWTFRALGIDHDFVQDNCCRSCRGVLRGLHYQVGHAAQGKLVWVADARHSLGAKPARFRLLAIYLEN